MKPIRYAIIGFGGIAENRVAKEGFACDSGRFEPLIHAQAVAAFDLNPARRAAAAALGLGWFDSFEAVLASPDIDAVYIATNNASHAKLALAALAAGKHAIVEKPMATSVADADALVALAVKKHLALSVDHMMVNNSCNVLAKKLVKSGRVGQVNDSCFHMEFAYGYDPAEAATWRCSRIEEMGGPIGDVASHCFYTAEFILGGTIVEVSAVYLPKLMKIAAEDGAFIKFKFDDGRTGSVRAAFSELRGGAIGTLSNLGYEIYGDAGVLRGLGTLFQLSGHPDEPYRPRLELETASGIRNPKPRKFPNIYQSLIEKHAASIQAKRPVNAADAVHNLALCAAAHASARNGGKTVVVK